jgi:hypothetical protein
MILTYGGEGCFSRMQIKSSQEYDASTVCAAFAGLDILLKLFPGVALHKLQDKRERCISAVSMTEL